MELMKEDNILVSFIINLFYEKPKMSQRKESIRKVEVRSNIRVFTFNS